MERLAGKTRPWSVQVELVEGCQRRCAFCGIRGIRPPGDDRLLFMVDLVVAAAISGIAGLCPEARLEFALHGEPLLHPNVEGVLAKFRSALPKAQIQLTTNGRALIGGMQRGLERLFLAGVDYVVMDTYRPERDALRAEAEGLGGVRVMDFYEEHEGFSPWHNHRGKVKRTLVLMDDLSLRDGEVRSRSIVNHAQNSPLRPPLRGSLKRKCTLPFREASISWDGDVNLCCMDWGHEFVCGNVCQESLAAIWNGSRFTSARRLLFHKERTFSPCARCDAPSGTRCGLLPRQAVPTAADYETVRSTVMGGVPRNGKTPAVFFKEVAHE